MSTSAPIKREYDIPIIRPKREPLVLPAGVPAPVIVWPVREPVWEPVRVRR